MNSSKGSLLCLQLVMGMVCAFHVIMGICLNFSTAMVDQAARLYGAEVAEGWSPQFLYILRPLGVFMLALGVFAALAAMNPRAHRTTIYVFAGVFVVRALHRVIFSSELSEVFGIASGRNAGNIAFFLGLAAVLILLDQLVHRQPAQVE